MNEKFVQSIRKIAWGTIICFFDFNLGTLDIIPDWWGILMMYEALTTISKQEKSIKLLEPLALILFVYNAIQWIFLTLFGMEINIYVVNVIFTIINLYFHFQLMTNIADIARKNGYEKYNVLLTLRTFKAIIITLSALPIDWSSMEVISFVYLAFALIVEISNIYYLFHYATYQEKRSVIEGP